MKHCKMLEINRILICIDNFQVFVRAHKESHGLIHAVRLENVYLFFCIAIMIC